MKILHVAAHMGGGIGSAYAGLGSCGQEQSVLLLEPPIDTGALDRVRASGFRILSGLDDVDVRKELANADLVVFSWHHHPALTKFLRELPRIPLRSILWCHVSGNYFPYVASEFVQKFNQSIFATPFTLDLPQIKAMGGEWVRERCSVVYGLNDLRRFARLRKIPHEKYAIGYIGTLGFCKLNPDFISFCGEVCLPDVQFMMVGAPSTQRELQASASQKGLSSQFDFLGQIPDVTQALSQMDIFGYLLNPQHFGATENALLEAVAASLPVIALDQCVEQGIIRDGQTGLLVHTPEEYGKAVRYLHDNPQVAERLGAAAREDILERYDIGANRQRFLAACERALTDEKSIHRFDDFFKGEPADWFLTGVNTDRACFEQDCPQDAGRIFGEATKGSPAHYSRYFQEDSRLARWAWNIQRGGEKANES